LWPPNRSPAVNPKDPPWGQGKDVCRVPEPYAIIAEPVGRFLDSLPTRTNPEALPTAGVLPREVLSQRGVGKISTTGRTGGMRKAP
jgi:hypothetical protein